MATGALVVEVEVRRARVALDWDGEVLDILGLELWICGSPAECRFDGVTDFEWARGRWMPWREL